MLRLSLLNLIAALLFLIASTLLWGAVFFHQQAVKEYRRAIDHHEAFRHQSNRLEETSDYLTNQARKFVINGERRYLDNYWREVEETRTRDLVLTQMENLRAPVEALRLLDQAKYQSDALIATETRAMRLMAETLGLENLPAPVAGWQLSKEDQSRTPEARQEMARRILFDVQYDTDKLAIYAPINEFKRLVTLRAQAGVRVAERQMSLATEVLNILTVVLPLLMAFIAWIQWRHLSRPIYSLLRQLQNRDPRNLDFSLPSVGVQELRKLATAFNDQLHTNRLQLRANQQQLQENQQLIEQMRGISLGLEGHNWSVTGQNQLNEQLIRDLPMADLCQAALQFLVEYTDARAGLFYLATDKNPLTLWATVGCEQRTQLLNRILPGEPNIVAQAALEKKVLVIHEPQRTDFPVHRDPPIGALYAVPIYYENRLQGALELAYTEPRENKVRDFLNQVTPTLGIALHSRLAMDQRTREVV